MRIENTINIFYFSRQIVFRAFAWHAKVDAFPQSSVCPKLWGGCSPVSGLSPHGREHGQQTHHLRAAFALDMERRGYYRTALSLYEKLLTEVPRTDWVPISERIKTLKSKMRAQTHSVQAWDKAPSSQPADKSARFHRRLDRLRKRLHQLRAFMQRRRHF